MDAYQSMDQSFSSIQYINLFLENVDKVRWSDDAEKAQLFARRTKGEAYGLRGMFLYYLLRAHAGFGENGELLGVPRLTEYLTINSDLNLPRASFADCVQRYIVTWKKPKNYFLGSIRCE